MKNIKQTIYKTAALLCLMITSLPGFAQEGNVPDAVERAALVDLYNSTNGAGWTNNTNWLNGTSSADFDTWFGVTVVDGDVTEIELSINNMSGEIPSSIGSLVGLQVLNLHQNFIINSIPTELGNLINLTKLYLSYNQISGSIPAEIGNLTNLERFSLDYNSLTGSIPSSIGNLSNLTQLDLRDNELISPLPIEIGNLDKLTYLRLGVNKFSGDIPFDLNSLPQLTYLYCHINEFDIFPTLINHPNVNNLRIDFSSNKIDFGSLEVNFTGIGIHPFNQINYSPQNEIGTEQTLAFNIGDPLDIPFNTGGTRNQYQWQKKDVSDTWRDIGTLSSTANYTKTSFEASDIGDYRVLVTNEWVTGLTLTSKTISVYQVDCGVVPDAIEYAALLDLYNTTNGAEWTNNTNWLNGTTCADFGNWFGVTVENGDITSVILNGNSLSGDISTLDISALTQLETLQIGNNNLSGNFPESLFELNSLSNLIIYNNALEGILNDSFQNLTALEEVRLNGNSFSGSLPRSLIGHSNVKIIIASNNEFEGSLPDVFDLNTSLERLTLHENNLSGTLPQTFYGNSGVKVINFSGNMLSGEISASIAGMTSLESFLVHRNDLTGIIPNELGGLQSLRHVNLSDNNLEGVIPDSFMGSTSLNEIYFQNNNISFAPDFSQSANASVRNIQSESNNLDFGSIEPNFSSVGTYPFSAFTYSPQSGIGTEQNLAFNIGDPLDIPFVTGGTRNQYQWQKKDGAGTWQPIGTLSSTANYTKTSFESSDIGEYRVLVTNEWVTGLTLTSKTISVYQADCGVVPDAVEYAALVDLYNATNGAEWSNNTNWLNGTTCVDFATWFGVTVVDGDVQEIKLNGNNLTGTLSSSLSDLQQLRLVHLYTNSINGTIPDEIGNLSNLEVLWLQNNSFSGDIPSNLSGLGNLISFALNDNELSGSIPYQIFDLPELELLDLHDNNLSGSIPTNVGNAQKVRDLNLSNNSISGVIPEEIGSMSNLLRLYLTNNALSGTFPQSIWALSNLEQFSVAHNDLSGMLDSGIGQLINLKSLFFSYNNFDGQLPVEIDNLTLLEVFRCEGNNFNGEFPLLTNPNLLVLDVSSNSLSGNMDISQAGANTLRDVTINDNNINVLSSLIDHPNSAELKVNSENNKIDFGSLEPNFESVGTYPFSVFTYSPQAEIGTEQNLAFSIGDPLDIPFATGGTRNQYQWQKKDGQGAWQPVGVLSSTANYSKASFESTDIGEYRVLVTNDWVTGLTLTSKTISVYQADCGVVPDAVEYAALVDLYNATNGAEWTNNTNWLNGSTCVDFANWFGVTVENGDVTEIRLHNNALNDDGSQLPESLGDLSQLKLLLLSSNQLKNSLPTRLNNLVNLEFLSLTDNEYQGDIPSVIYELTSLETLSLGNNNWTGGISSDISGLIHLVSFSVNNALLTGGLPSEIGDLSDLNSLNLVNNSFSGPIPDQWSNLSEMAILNLRNNLLSGPVPSFFKNFTKLEWLILDGNDFTGPFPDLSNGDLPNLEVLNIRNNRFESLPDLTNISTIQSIFCQDNNIDFGSLEPNFEPSGTHPYPTFTYSPQAEIGSERTLTFNVGDPMDIPFVTGGTRNRYQWQKEDNSGTWQPVGTLSSTANYIKSSFEDSDAGQYRVLVTNDWVTGLTLTSKVITVNADCGIQITYNSSSDNGSGNGTIDLTVSGGTAPYTFEWSNGLPPTEDQTNLSGGGYSVTVTDASGCTANSEPFVFLQQCNIELTETVVITDASCISNGKIYATFLEDISSSSYLIQLYDLNLSEFVTNVTFMRLSNNEIEFDNVSPGTYIVTIQDLSSGCSTNFGGPLGIIVNEVNSLLSIEFSVSPDQGLSNGSINLTVTGGVAPYTYQWSGGLPAQEDHIGTVAAGLYDVIVTDANGCDATLEGIEVIQEGCSFDISFVSTPDTGGENGTIDLTITGTTSPYTFTWSHGLPPQEDQTGLRNDTYSVTVTDSEGCSETHYMVLSNNCIDLQAFEYNTTDVKCNGANDGTITFRVTKGTAPYEFELFEAANGTEVTVGGSYRIGDNTAVFFGLPSGEYIVGVRQINCDFIGLVEYRGIVIGEPTALSATFSVTNDTGGANGAIDLTVSGGTAPYSFSWSGGLPDQEDHAGIASGNYTVTITDNKGCQLVVEDIFVNTSTNCVPNNPYSFVMSLESITNYACNDGVDTGEITVLLDFLNSPPFAGVTYDFRLFEDDGSFDAYSNTGGVLVQEFTDVAINNDLFTFTFSDVLPTSDSYAITVFATGINPPQDDTCPFGTYRYLKGLTIEKAPLPLATFKLNHSLIREGDVITAKPTQFIDGYTYQYNWGDGNVTATPHNSTMHRYDASGTYTITSLVTSDQGCVSTASQTLEVFDFVCESAVPDNGGAFFVDSATGKIVFKKDDCPGNFMLTCVSATAAPNIFDNTISASTVTFSDEWPMDELQSRLADMPEGSNSFETGESGKWKVKNSYAYKTELFETDKNYSNGTFKVEDFSWRYEEVNDPYKWIKSSTVEKYSSHGEALQERNALQIASASKFGYDGALPYLTVQNADYEDVYFESFEKRYDGVELEEGIAIQPNGLTITGQYAHSGRKSATFSGQYKQNLATLSPQLVENGLWFKVWVRPDQSADLNSLKVQILNIAGGTISETTMDVVANVGEWKLLEARITDFGSLTLGEFRATSDRFRTAFFYDGPGTIWIDDARIQPSDAQMTTYVYNPRNFRLITVFDDRHFGLYYQYNGEGQLVRKQIETERGLKTVQETQYNIPKTDRDSE